LGLPGFKNWLDWFGICGFGKEEFAAPKGILEEGFWLIGRRLLFNPGKGYSYFPI